MLVKPMRFYNSPRRGETVGTSCNVCVHYLVLQLSNLFRDFMLVKPMRFYNSPRTSEIAGTSCNVCCHYPGTGNYQNPFKDFMLVKPMRFYNSPRTGKQRVPRVTYLSLRWCCNYQIPLGISCW